MNSLDMSPLNNLDEAVMAAHAMFRKGKREEACYFLARKRDEAVSSGALGEASTYASIRGSYLVAMRRDSDALEAYMEAERLSEDEADSLLRTARHLIVGMKQPTQALERADAILAFEDNSYHLTAHEIRGLALLALDQPEEASKELQTVFLGIDQLPSQSCDLILVEALSQKHLEPELCQRYLDAVETKAREEEEDRVLKRVLKIKALLL
jgi:tetratricopeptide (TPR) repeat protein